MNAAPADPARLAQLLADIGELKRLVRWHAGNVVELMAISRQCPRHLRITRMCAWCDNQPCRCRDAVAQIWPEYRTESPHQNGDAGNPDADTRNKPAQKPGARPTRRSPETTTEYGNEVIPRAQVERAIARMLALVNGSTTFSAADRSAVALASRFLSDLLRLDVPSVAPAPPSPPAGPDGAENARG